MVSEPVSKKFGTEKSLGTGLEKNWYRKKSRNQSRKNLVPKKSLGTGLAQILGLVTHCYHQSPWLKSLKQIFSNVKMIYRDFNYNIEVKFFFKTIHLNFWVRHGPQYQKFVKNGENNPNCFNFAQNNFAVSFYLRSHSSPLELKM